MSDERLLLLKLLGRDFRDNWPSFKNKLQRSLARWRTKFLTDLGKLIVLSLCVWGGYVVFLYYLQSMWLIFAETQIGRIFATQVSPGIAVAITSVLDLELSGVAYDCVINILMVTVPAGVLLKFSGLYRFAYLNRGAIGYISWGIVCAAGTAEMLPIVGAPGYLQGNAAIYFPPTICLLAGSFALSAWLVPEFTVVFRFVEFLRERVQVIKIRDLPYHQKI